MKYQGNETASWWNIKAMKQRVDEMDGKLGKQRVDETSRKQETASWWNGKLAKR